MSSQAFNASQAGKKAVHVKWAGKTIALGTFPSSEADEKCARAKALTRAWRSTMRPKPSREWVMLELERLGVRVVSGRLGRKAGEEGEEGLANEKVGPSKGPMGSAPIERSGSMGWGGDDFTSMMARRNSSLGLSMMSDRRGSLSSLGQVMGLDGDSTIPPHRPLVGGGAAAAYEAARHDHFTQKSAEHQARRASSLGLGGFGGMSGMSVNPNQHYEMLKLHHMNLLNEIQETTLMMNLYQQQQLQQQQQALQQESGGSVSSGDPMSMMNHLGQGIDSMYTGPHGQRSSMGFGGPQMSGYGSQQMHMMQQMNDSRVTGMGAGQVGMNQQDMDSRLAQLKEDIARRGNGQGTDANLPVNKRMMGGNVPENHQNKRQKMNAPRNALGDDDDDDDGNTDDKDTEDHKNEEV